MVSFYVWSISIILYQTFFDEKRSTRLQDIQRFVEQVTGSQPILKLGIPNFVAVMCMMFSWLTLQCRMVPRPTEPRELTLIKLMYLYEPSTCGRIYYYNYTVAKTNKITLSNILWLEYNPLAASFRNKMKLWLGLHVTWLGLALLNVSQGRRSCGFYTILLPLTIVGLALLVVDIVHAAFFLRDAVETQTEAQIWDYIGNVEEIKKIEPLSAMHAANASFQEDTSWVALLFAYTSVRAIVQLIINFWIVQDTYIDGLHYYRGLKLYGNRMKKMQSQSLI